MGVEYQHWIVAVDPSFVPSREAAARTHEVLTAWGLVLLPGNPFRLSWQQY